jgi:hypothetical protein
LIDAVEGIMAWNAVGEFKVAAEPFLFGDAEFLHVFEAFAAADDGT